MDFYVFKDFELLGVLTGYSHISWNRSYNDVGSFEMEMIFSTEYFDMLNIGNVVYKKNTKEACIILERYVYTTEKGESILNIKGNSLSHYLSYRIFSYTGNTSLYDFISKIINENFIAPSVSNRKVDSFILKALPQELKNIKLSLEYDKKEVLSAIAEQLQLIDYGFKMNFLIDEKKLEFEVYKGINSSAIFSIEFNNISSQEYYENLSKEKNITVLENGDFSNNSYKGLFRKESPSNIVKIDKNIEFVVIDSSTQYKYLEDWNLGDIVTTKNSMLNISFNKNVVGVEEFIEPSGNYVTLTFN